MISNNELDQLHNEFKTLEKEIKSAQSIVIYRHQSPDFDALGAQMGLYQFIKDNFPDKQIHFFGDINNDLIPSLFPQPEVLEENDILPTHLAIVCDTSNISRISMQHLSQAYKVIKIDHHPLPSKKEEEFGDLLIVHPSRPAASEILALFMLSRNQRKYKISKQTATYLYIGITGDTGQFSYQDTDGATFRITGDLIDLGVDVNKVSFDMFSKSEQRMSVLKFILDTYKKTENGFYYVIFKKEDLEKFNITIDQGNEFIKNLRNIKECKVAATFTYDSSKDDYRVSLRSSNIKISDIAIKYNGGGHDYASGCHIKSLDLIPEISKDIDEIIINSQKETTQAN